MSGKKVSWLKSCGAAWQGIVRTVKNERNGRLHLAATVLVITAGFLSSLERWEWAAILLVIAFVWSTELINTALETLLDRLHPEAHPLIGAAKDAAAGAVLVAALAAVLIGILVFGPRLWF